MIYCFHLRTKRTKMQSKSQVLMPRGLLQAINRPSQFTDYAFLANIDKTIMLVHVCNLTQITSQKVILISILWISNTKWARSPISKEKESLAEMGENVPLWSRSSLWMHHLIINVALYFYISPLTSHSILKNYSWPTILQPVGNHI